MIKYEVGNLITNVRQWFFPDGCVGTNINIGTEAPNPERMDIFVTMIFGSTDEHDKQFSINDDLMALAQVADALRRQYPLATLFLAMPYVPYARQDRACSPGDAFSLGVAAKMINGMGFTTVAVGDPHSPVAGAVLNNMFVTDQAQIFGKVRDFTNVYIVAPDQGATKKCEEFAKAVVAAGVITCSKVRDMETGKIIKFKLLDEVIEGSEFFVLDDICDGGFTFNLVAMALTEACNNNIARLDLAVTHGLFTKGTGLLTSIYDNVYTTNTYISDKTGCEVIDLL